MIKLTIKDDEIVDFNEQEERLCLEENANNCVHFLIDKDNLFFIHHAEIDMFIRALERDKLLNLFKAYKEKLTEKVDNND